MDSSIENIDHAILQSGDPTMSAEWSMTASLLNSPNTSSNPNINIDTLKECCANSLDTLNDKDFKVLESTSTAINISKFNDDDTKNLTVCKPSAFQKKHKSSFSNMSHMFENLLDDDSQMELTENSVYLNRFQKRKRLLPSNDEYYVEMNKSDSSGVDSVDVSIKSSKLRFSSKNKNKSCFEAPDYNLSTTEGTSIADANISKVTEEKTAFKHPSNFSLLINDSTNNVDESKTEVSCKFIRKPVDLVDSAFDNVINDLSRTSDVELNNKNTTLNESSGSILNSDSFRDRAETFGLNNTYNINETYTLGKDSMSNNVSLSSLSAKNILSDTYTIESNLNDTSFELKSANKTSTLSDMSNIYNQSNSSEHKPNFIRKLQVDNVSQDYNITINNDDNSSVNDALNQTDNNKSGRFKLNKRFHNGHSVIFDNIITSSQKNETLSNDAISKTLNTSVESSKPDDLFHISSESKPKQNEEISFNKSMTQQSNTQINEFIDNDKNISENSILLQLDKSNSYSSHSGKFNFFKQSGRLSSSYRENSTTVMLSQSSGPHFVGKQNLTTHSGEFNDIIDNSFNSNVSQNVSKEVKFKNHKNISETDSIIFGNVITNSQESNSTLNINKTLSQSFMYDQSKIQENDEISLYANANELSSNENSLNNSNNSFKNIENSEELNLDESTHLRADISCTSNYSKNSKTEYFNELSTQNISTMLKESEHNTLSNMSAGLLKVDSLSCTNLTKSTSNKSTIGISGDLNNSFIPEYTPNNTNNTSNHVSEHSSIASNSEGLTLLYSTSESLVTEDNSINSSRISTRSSKRKNESSANDSRSSISNVANKSLKKDNVNVESLEQISNSTFLVIDDAKNKSVVSSFTDESNKSTCSSRASETSDSSNNREKSYINVSVLEDDMKSVSKTSYSSKQTNYSPKNDQKTELSITDKLPETKKLLSPKVTRSSSVCVNNNKSLTNKIVLGNDSLNSENNLNKISTRSSRTKIVAYSSNECTDDETNDSGSVFWTSASSINSRKMSINNGSMLQDDMNNVSKTSYSSKQKNNSANDQKTELSITDESPKNKKSPSAKVTRSSSVSVKNNKSLTNKTVLDNESLNSENNLNKTSTRSSRTKIVANSNKEYTDNETNDSGSEFWITSSSINSGKTPINNESMLQDDMNNVSETSYSSKQKNNSANDQKTELSITDELPENQKSTSAKVTRLSSVSVKNDKSINNENIGDEVNDSALWTTVTGSSINSRKSSNTTHIPEGMDNVDIISTSFSKQINNHFTNNIAIVSSINDELPENNKQQSSTIETRSPVSDKNKVSLTNKTVLGNESLVSENNVNKRSTSSSKTSKIFTNSNNENIDDDSNDDSIFWKTLSETESKSSTRTSLKKKDCDESLVLKNDGNNISSHSSRTSISVTHSSNKNDGNEINDSVFWTTVSESFIGSSSTSLSKQINNSSVNELSTVPGTRVTRSSVSVKNKSLTNKTVPDNESLLSENNVSKLSTSSPKISKIVSDSSSRNIGHETNDSTFWETFSEDSINSKKIFNNSLMSSEDMKNVRRTSTRLSKQKNNSSIISHTNDDLSDINKSLRTRQTRQSSVSNKKKRSSSISKSHKKNMSNRSFRSSKNIAHSSSENVDDGIDDSMDWTTVSDDYSNELPDQNDGLQTPKNNKLTIREHIKNTIGIMSVNKRNPTHPGVFELEENCNGPLTRSFTSHLADHSPSILTRVLLANNNYESNSSLLSGTEITDETQVEDNVKEKFKSLYNKEPWITKRLYNFLISKLKLKYNIYAVKYAEKFVKYLASILKRVHRNKVDFQLYTDMLKYHMARYGIIITTFDYLGFLTDYIPKPYYDRLMPSWDLETSVVKYDPSKYFVPINEDEEFLRSVLERLNNANPE